MKMSWDKSETDEMAEVLFQKAGVKFVSDAEAIEILQQRISALESALVEIRDHPHCNVSNSGCVGIRCDNQVDDAWRIVGCTQGHRCCAEIARKALEKK